MEPEHKVEHRRAKSICLSKREVVGNGQVCMVLTFSQRWVECTLLVNLLLVQLSAIFANPDPKLRVITAVSCVAE